MSGGGLDIWQLEVLRDGDLWVNLRTLKRIKGEERDAW